MSDFLMKPKVDFAFKEIMSDEPEILDMIDNYKFLSTKDKEAIRQIISSLRSKG